MRWFPWELFIALLSSLGIACLYTLASAKGVPSPAGAVGLALGIVGFSLMLKTEIVYTLRKKLHRFTWGRTSFWLKFHITTGLVGPFLVLLHTGWKFNGVAGAATVVMGLVVLSGFVGRYIYTATPRTIYGEFVDPAELLRVNEQIDEVVSALSEAAQARVVQLHEDRDLPSAARIIVIRRWLLWRYHLQIRAILKGEPQLTRADRAGYEGILVRRRNAELQAHALSTARAALSVWHTLHVPMGTILFVLAGFHIAGAVYYSFNLR